MADAARARPDVARWRVVIPVKPGEVGKSRLRTDAAALGDVDRAALARAIALDTIRAAAQVADVVVVTDDATLARAIPSGVVVVADPGGGLDAAIAAGAGAGDGADGHRATLGGDGGGADGLRAALLGDLPALRPADLAAALAAALEHERAAVADADGSGTTLLTARAGVTWSSAFGPDSLARHRALGAAILDAGPSLRRDVDTPADLAAAAALGLGPHTAALLAP